jgi:hypothetical protein
MPLSSSIIDRIVKESGFPALANFPGGGLSPGDLESLLMHVYRTRAAGVTKPDVMRTSERPLLPVSDIDARLLQLFDRVAFEAAAGFEAVDLSPVALQT